ncbi:MAG: hypothetical protein ACP5QA_11180 [Phycisphaerae bacterium]
MNVTNDGSRTARLKTFARKYRMVILLLVLILAVVLVYGRFLGVQHKVGMDRGTMPAVIKVMARNGRKPLVFPLAVMLNNKIPQHQRRIAVEAFFLAYTKASPSRRLAMVQHVQGLLAMMKVKIRLGTISKIISDFMLHGDPQMSAATLQFVMALRNNK